MRRRTKTTHLVLHTFAYEGVAGVAKVRNWHVHGNGWSDIGYHYVIRRDGTRETGRDEWRQGSHARGFNARSIGVAFEGHGDKEPLTPEQVTALLDLYNDLTDRYDIPPENVIGHRETYRGRALKTCPGLLVDMARIRSLISIWLSISDQPAE